MGGIYQTGAGLGTPPLARLPWQPRHRHDVAARGFMGPSGDAMATATRASPATGTPPRAAPSVPPQNGLGAGGLPRAVLSRQNDRGLELDSGSIFQYETYDNRPPASDAKSDAIAAVERRLSEDGQNSPEGGQNSTKKDTGAVIAARGIRERDFGE